MAAVDSRGVHRHRVRVGPLYKKAIGWLNNPVGSLVGKQLPVNPAPARPLGDYTGSYTSDYWGRAVVTERDSARVLLVTPPDVSKGASKEQGEVEEIGRIPETDPRR